MTREQQLKFCKVCVNKKMNLQKGIVCGLTGEQATFQDECPDFKKDTELIESQIINTQRPVDNSARASLVIKVLWGIAIVNVISIISGIMEYSLLERVANGSEYYYEELDSNDIRQGLVGLLQGGLYLASIITFLNWFRRSYANLEKVGTTLEHNHSMAVYGFMIPFVNLVRPYHIAKEIAQGTRKKLKEFSETAVSVSAFPIIGIWWTFFIITGILGQLAFRTSLRAETIDQMIFSSQAYIVSDLIDIPAAIITVFMITRISKDEKELFKIYNKI